MSEHTPAPADKGLARRRLLRGTFAAPVVLTMYSGGALAATSATCVAKAQSNPQTAPLLTAVAPTDTYLRVQLDQVSAVSPALPTYWLSGARLKTFTNGGSVVTDAKFTRFLELTNTLSTAAGEVNVTPAATPSNPAKWVALRFDGTGRLVGVGATGGGSAITQSCWTSAF